MNLDFNDGTLNGWTYQDCQNIDSQNMTMTSCGAYSESALMGPGSPEVNGVPITMISPLGGYFLRHGNIATGGHVQTIQQEFRVPAGVTRLIYCYAVVFENSSQACADQPYFIGGQWDTLQSSPSLISGNYSHGYGPACSGANPVFLPSGGYSYHDWIIDTVDLSGYTAGQKVNLTFWAAGETVASGTKAGYVYLDVGTLPGISTSIPQTQEPVLYNLFPNPSNGELILSYTLNKEAELIISDLTGREIQHHILTSSQHSFSFDSCLPDGLYLYTIRQQGRLLKQERLIVINK